MSLLRCQLLRRLLSHAETRSWLLNRVNVNEMQSSLEAVMGTVEDPSSQKAAQRALSALTQQGSMEVGWCKLHL